MLYNFNKYTTTTIDSLGTPYDYLSMMHYPDWAFSNNGKPSIVTKDKSMQKVIGQRGGMSAIDKVQINKLYCKNGMILSTALSLSNFDISTHFHLISVAKSLIQYNLQILFSSLIRCQ